MNIKTIIKHYTIHETATVWNVMCKYIKPFIWSANFVIIKCRACQWFPYPKNLIVCRIQCFLLHSGFSFSQIGRIRYEVTLNIPRKQSTSSLWRKDLFRGERGGWYWDGNLTGQIDSSSCLLLPDSGTEQQRCGTPATCAHSLVKTGCSLERQHCCSHYCIRLQHCR